jgi:hypothetical protein
MLTGSRPIGPKSVRIIENAFNKPRGWMDFLHDDEEEAKLPEDIKNLALRLAAQTPEQIEMLNALLKAAKIDAEVPKNVIAVNKEAMVVTDPVEKNLIEAYRSTDSRGHELLASAATIARSYGRQTFITPSEDDQQNNKNHK